MSKESVSDVLPKWLTKLGGKFNGLQLKTTSFQKFQLVASKPHQEKQELLVIPADLAITAESLSLSEIRKQFQSLDESTSSEAGHATDDLIGVEELAVAILWEVAHLESSKWKVYLTHLPALIDSVMSCWTEEEREELRGTTLLPVEDDDEEEGKDPEDEDGEGANEEEEKVSGLIRSDKFLQTIFQKNILPLLEMWWRHEHQSSDPVPDLPASFTFEKYKSILCVVMSYGNETLEGEPCLVPFSERLTYTMHGKKANASLSVDEGNYKITSTIPINKGDPIVIPCVFPLCNGDLVFRFGASAINAEMILDYDPEKEKNGGAVASSSSSSSSSSSDSLSAAAKGKKGKKKTPVKSQKNDDQEDEDEERPSLVELDPSQFKPFDSVSISISQFLDYYDQKGEEIEVYQEKLAILDSIGMFESNFIINSYDMEFPVDLIQTVSIICMTEKELKDFAQSQLGASLEDILQASSMFLGGDDEEDEDGDGCEDEGCVDTSCCPTKESECAKEQDLKDEPAGKVTRLIPKKNVKKVKIDLDEDDEAPQLMTVNTEGEEGEEDLDDDDDDDLELGFDEEGGVVLCEDQVKMFDDLSGILKVRLEKYTTTLEDDTRELASLPKKEAKKIASILVRMGEKRLLLAMSDYAIYQKSVVEEELEKQKQQQTEEIAQSSGSKKRPRPSNDSETKKGPKAKKQKKA